MSKHEPLPFTCYLRHAMSIIAPLGRGGATIYSAALDVSPTHLPTGRCKCVASHEPRCSVAPLPVARLQTARTLAAHNATLGKATQCLTTHTAADTQSLLNTSPWAGASA